MTVIALKACDIVLIFIAQMGLKEDEYALRLLGFKLQIERISAAASHLVCTICGSALACKATVQTVLIILSLLVAKRRLFESRSLSRGECQMWRENSFD